eukprot:gene54-80_t
MLITVGCSRNSYRGLKAGLAILDQQEISPPQEVDPGHTITNFLFSPQHDFPNPPSVFYTKEGHQVQLLSNGREALMRERLAAGVVGRQLILPLYKEDDKQSITSLLTIAHALPKHCMQVQLPARHDNIGGFVYIGRQGLLGGMEGDGFARDRKQAEEKVGELEERLSNVGNEKQQNDLRQANLDKIISVWADLESRSKDAIPDLVKQSKALSGRIKHVALTKILTILDGIEGVDEIVRPHRQKAVQRTITLLDALEDFIKSWERVVMVEEKLGEQEKVEKEGEKILINPTGKGIGNDCGGLGHFGAKRGNRRHEGIDFSTTIGQDIVAPFEGSIVNRIGESTKAPLIDIWPKKRYLAFDFLQILYVDKPVEMQWEVARYVKAGEVIGTAANLQTLTKPYPTMKTILHSLLFLFLSVTPKKCASSSFVLLQGQWMCMDEIEELDVGSCQSDFSSFYGRDAKLIFSIKQLSDKGWSLEAMGNKKAPILSYLPEN